MLSRRDDPFPFEAVRDLLGLLRAIYAARKGSGAPADELLSLASAGKDLKDALALASGSRPGTVGYAAAWKRAEEATERAGGLVSALPPAPVLKAAAQRVIKRR